MSEPTAVPESAAVADVVEITAAETHPLRLAVLRRDTPTKVVEFPEDVMPGAVHLGIRVADELVGVSSWTPRPYRDRPALQLRGMATALDRQSTGLGGALLEEGCRRAAARGVTLVWANARDAALDFYLRHGFVVDGEGFIDDKTQLPHHVVIRHLA